MKKTAIHLLVWVLCLPAVLFGTDLNDVALEGIPAWATPKQFRGDRHPFDIRLLAKKEGLSLREALEVQNHYLDMVDDTANARSPEEKFRLALSRVKSDENIYENVWNGEKIDRAAFIVVFDLDDTLLSQYYTSGNKGEKYRDIKLQEGCLRNSEQIGSRTCGNCIKFAPGWKECIEGIKLQGGAVVFFTAKRDSRAQQILDHWFWDSQTPITSVIDGFLTKNHLTLVPKTGKTAGRLRAMKDLQLIDPSLQRIVMVDDSPSHTYQPMNVRPVQRFLPDSYLADGTPPEITGMYENTLKEVAGEIVESIGFAEENKIGFVEAYRPYSLIGRYALFDLMDTGLSKTEAALVLRKFPCVIENKF